MKTHTFVARFLVAYLYVNNFIIFFSVERIERLFI